MQLSLLRVTQGNTSGHRWVFTKLGFHPSVAIASNKWQKRIYLLSFEQKRELDWILEVNKVKTKELCWTHHSVIPALNFLHDGAMSKIEDVLLEDGGLPDVLPLIVHLKFFLVEK